MSNPDIAWLKQTIRTPDGEEVEGYELVQIIIPSAGMLVQALEIGVAVPEPRVEPIRTDDNKRLVLLPGASLHVMESA